MPVKNVIKILTPQTFYHVYNRGHNRETLFADEADYHFFEFLLQRCFGPEQLERKEGKTFPWFGAEIELAAYCLMPNHYHLLLYQKNSEQALSKVMQSLGTTYTMYFNTKYKRRGSAFESAFKASPVYDDTYLQHVTRYIHLNHHAYQAWQYSSYEDYLDNPRRWVRPEVILALFDGKAQYKEFVDDHAALRHELDTLKHILADSTETYV